MAIRDLLSACPLCLQPSALRTVRRAEICSACGASFRRGNGATIVAFTADGQRIQKAAADWLDRVHADRRPNRPATLGPEPVELRLASRRMAIRRKGRLLGWRDELRPPRRGTLRLDDGILRFEGEGGPVDWRLEAITAIQPTSASLQIKAKGETVASIRFRSASVRLWEDVLHSRIRQAWRAAGRGEIVEFQPRITER